MAELMLKKVLIFLLSLFIKLPTWVFLNSIQTKKEVHFGTQWLFAKYSPFGVCRFPFNVSFYMIINSVSEH